MDHHHPHHHLSLDSGKISFATVFILSSVDTVRIKRLGRVVQRTFHRTSIRIKMSVAKVFSPHKVTDTIFLTEKDNSGHILTAMQTRGCQHSGCEKAVGQD